jgi:hypothetical protein
MDSLLQLANLENPDSAKHEKSNKRKRSRSSERGFQGTLLHSSAPSATNQGADSNGNKTMAKPDVSTISDEEKDGPIVCAESEVTEEKPQVVLNDSSENDELQASSPFLREVISGTKTIVECESPGGTKHKIAEHLVNGGVVEGDACVVLDGQGKKAIEIETNDRDQLQEDLVASILKLLGDHADQSKCWDAVEWSLKTNPQEKNQEVLLDGAIGKYFSS